jgi:hypothetical protein
MPVVSQAQRGAMYAAKEGKSTLGIPQSVGADFIAATPAGAKLPKRVGKGKKKPGKSLGDLF